MNSTDFILTPIRTIAISGNYSLKIARFHLLPKEVFTRKFTKFTLKRNTSQQRSFSTGINWSADCRPNFQNYFPARFTLATSWQLWCGWWKTPKRRAKPADG